MTTTTLIKPQKPSKLIASIPHGSTMVTDEMKMMIHDDVLLTNNDWELNRMYNFLPDMGVSLISANYSRYMADVNRNLETLVFESCRFHDRVFLWDLHSFDTHTTSDIVLGTRGGTSCSHEFIEVVKNAFLEENFTVEIDVQGLRGGFITKRYSEIENVEAIQIEMRYSTYLESREFGKEVVRAFDSALFDSTKQRLINVFNRIIKQVEAF